jgi:hypothetical protein
VCPDRSISERIKRRMWFGWWEDWLCCLRVGRRCFGLHPLASRAVSKVEMVSVSMEKAGCRAFGGS